MKKFELIEELNKLPNYPVKVYHDGDDKQGDYAVIRVEANVDSNNNRIILIHTEEVEL